MTALRDLIELTRLPAALTVPGDTLAGAAAAGSLPSWRAAPLAASSACLYWAGMALNDYADRELDAQERPERPIPSGRVSPSTALRLAGGLTLAGLTLAATAGPRPLAVALPLAGAVWTYDLIAKPTVAGPLVMGTTRFLDVLMGGTANPRRALPAALALGVHTTAVTVLSRGEVHGTSTRTATATVATTGVVASAAAIQSLRDTSQPPAARIAGAALAGTYASAVGQTQGDAVARPDPATVRRATRRGIHGMVPLQASLIARRGHLGIAAGLLALGPLLRAAAKVVSPT
ncbi:SCO3242 family prenyltransferase [Ruania zhangjianzhongii]|uniref:SCO3242 family prenyltransferase n=1 Tax=Ruania zhangjianzhongii TaxID=2603206 RepID=UPI0011C78831|nr:UbiA family prenyltransferase [Ruania zhangjianzhongii]